MLINALYLILSFFFLASCVSSKWVLLSLSLSLSHTPQDKHPLCLIEIGTFLLFFLAKIGALSFLLSFFGVRDFIILSRRAGR